MTFPKTLPAGLLTLGLCVMLAGCPYRSEVPIDAPSSPVDTRLIGAWREDSSSTSPQYTVTSEGSLEYRIVSEGDSGRSVFRAHLTPLGDSWYLNLRDEAGSDPMYSLFRFEIADDGASFTLYPLTENITESFTQSADLRSFVEKNQALSFFFEKAARYVKVTASP